MNLFKHVTIFEVLTFVLALTALIMIAVMLSKVKKCCKNTEKYDIQPQVKSNTDGTYNVTKGTYKNGSASDCINSGINNESYYCDGTMVDPTDDNTCNGAAAFFVSNGNELGSCNNPINSSSDSPYVLCSGNVNYPIATSNCNSPITINGLPEDVNGSYLY